MLDEQGEDITFFENVISSGKVAVDSATNSVATSPVISSEKKWTDEPKKVNQTAPNDKTITGFQGKYKVGDIIPLDELERIDPKLSKKSRFSTVNELAVTQSNQHGAKCIDSAATKEVSSIDLSSAFADKKTNGKGVRLKGFDELAILVHDKHVNDNQKVLPATGEVTYIDFDRNFGFIKDYHSRSSIYFSLNQILDSTLRQNITKNSAIVYSVESFSSGEQAWYIHRPIKVAELLQMSSSLSASGNTKQALAILEHILGQMQTSVFDMM